MKRSLLLAYQVLTGLSDTSTGLLLIVAPVLTLRLMKLHVVADSLPFLSSIDVFVLSVGIGCLYGTVLVRSSTSADKLEVVWLLTAITRGLVGVFVVVKVASGVLEPGWSYTGTIAAPGDSTIQVSGVFTLLGTRTTLPSRCKFTLRERQAPQELTL
jgi:hypothetical protein